MSLLGFCGKWLGVAEENRQRQGQRRNAGVSPLRATRFGRDDAGVVAGNAIQNCALRASVEMTLGWLQGYSGLSSSESSPPMRPLIRSPGVTLMGLGYLTGGFQSVCATWKVTESTSVSVSRTVVVSVPYLRKISGWGRCMPITLLAGPSLRPSAALSTVRV